MSPREFNGHVYTTTQHGYDELGQPTPVRRAHTIVTEHEPRWDDDDRAQMLGLRLYESQVCSGCGFHDSQKVPGRDVYAIEEDHCVVCASTAQAQRGYELVDAQAITAAEEHPAPEKNLKKTPTTPMPYDGRRIYVRRQLPTDGR